MAVATVPQELVGATPAGRLAEFLSKYSPEVAREARAALGAMRRLAPGAIELVYDNYNALVIGFGPSERPSEAIFSIALYPDHVSLCFLQGAELDDPDGLLRGSGRVVRHVRLTGSKGLSDRRVRSLVRRAKTQAVVTIPKGQRRKLIIRSVSAKQRPRRPAGPRASR
jgi:hypothetical protein